MIGYMTLSMVGFNIKKQKNKKKQKKNIILRLPNTNAYGKRRRGFACLEK